MADKEILRFPETRAGKTVLIETAICLTAEMFDVPVEAIIDRTYGEAACLIHFAALKFKLQHAMDLDEMSRKPKRAA